MECRRYVSWKDEAVFLLVYASIMALPFVIIALTSKALAMIPRF